MDINIQLLNNLTHRTTLKSSLEYSEVNKIGLLKSVKISVLKMIQKYKLIPKNAPFGRFWLKKELSGLLTQKFKACVHRGWGAF